MRQKMIFEDQKGILFTGIKMYDIAWVPYSKLTSMCTSYIKGMWKKHKNMTLRENTASQQKHNADMTEVFELAA